MLILTIIAFPHQAIVAIIIGCMCLVGIIVATILFVVLMRKPPDETVAGRAAASFGGLAKATDGAPNFLGARHAVALTLFLADSRRSCSRAHPCSPCSHRAFWATTDTHTMHRADRCACGPVSCSSWVSRRLLLLFLVLPGPDGGRRRSWLLEQGPHGAAAVHRQVLQPPVRRRGPRRLWGLGLHGVLLRILLHALLLDSDGLHGPRRVLQHSA